MQKPLLASLGALALSTAMAGRAAPASATIVYVTVTGTVASGSDGSGLFGTVGANLAGDPYTAQYEFDTGLGDASSSATENYVVGGSFYIGTDTPYNYTTSPSLGATLTVNGQSFSIAGTYFGEIYGANNSNNSESYAKASASSFVALDNDLNGSPGSSPASITTAFSITSAGELTANGAFFDGATLLSLTTTVYAESLTAPAAVPEPASMALIGVGLLGTSVMARRRRPDLTATAG